MIHRRQENWPNAIEIFNEVIKEGLPAQSIEARIERGATFKHKNDFDKALSDYRDVLDMPEAVPSQKARALIQRGILYREKKEWPKSLHDLLTVEQMLDAEPHQRINARIQRGLTLERQGRVNEAIDLFHEIIESSEAGPEHKNDATMRLGVVYRRLKQWSNSIDSFTEVAKHGVNSALRYRALYQQAFTYKEKRDRKKSIEDYQILANADDAPPDLRKKARKDLDSLGI